MSDLFLPAQRCERIYEYTMTGTAPAWFEPEALAFRQRVLESIEGLSPLALAERAERLNREQVTHHLQYEPERRIAQGSELYPGK